MSTFDQLLSDEQRTASESDNAARALNIALHELDMTLPGTKDHDAKKRLFEAARVRFTDAGRLWDQAKKKLDAHVRRDRSGS